MKYRQLFLIACLLVAGCQDKVHFRSVPQKAPEQAACSVAQTPDGALITCPDGSSELVAPITVTTQGPIVYVNVPGTTVYVDVPGPIQYVEVPTECPGNSNPGSDPQPDHGKDDEHGHKGKND